MIAADGAKIPCKPPRFLKPLSTQWGGVWGGDGLPDSILKEHHSAGFAKPTLKALPHCDGEGLGMSSSNPSLRLIIKLELRHIIGMFRQQRRQ